MVRIIALLAQLMALPLLVVVGWKIVWRWPLVLNNQYFSRACAPIFSLSHRKRKWLAYSALVLSQLLYASFAPIAKSTLNHLDPMIFVALQMLFLLPFSCFWVIEGYRYLTVQGMRLSLLLGLCLSAALLLLTWSLERTGMMETTLFQSLNGLSATGIAVFILRQQLSWKSKLACLSLALGTGLIWLSSRAHWEGNMAAFVGGSLLIIFAFLVERLLVPETQHHPQRLWPLLGIVCITISVTTLLIALSFGDWKQIQTLQANDVLVLGYTGIVATLLPLILTLKAQRSVSAVTVTYLAILEPIGVTIIALLVGERLEPLAYIGGSVILLGVVLQAMTGAEPHVVLQTVQQWEDVKPPVTHTKVEKRDFPTLGRRTALLVALLAQTPQGADLVTLQQWTGASRKALYQQLSILQRQGYIIRQISPQCRYLLHPTYLMSTS